MPLISGVATYWLRKDWLILFGYSCQINILKLWKKRVASRNEYHEIDSTYSDGIKRGVIVNQVILIIKAKRI